MNRIPLRYPLTHIPQCGNCKKRLPERFAIRAGRFKNRHRSIISIAISLSIFGGVGLAAYLSPSKPSRVVLPRLEDLPTPDLCADRPQPRQGIFRNYDRSARVAELTIRTASGSNYFVKLEEAASKRPVMTFFVNGGSSLTEMVPLGNFVLKYAAGPSWCSEDELFGNDIISTANDEFLFERHYTGDGYSTSAWTVELILQPGGNLRTHRISRSEF
jgi:hypothetical protein